MNATKQRSGPRCRSSLLLSIIFALAAISSSGCALTTMTFAQPPYAAVTSAAPVGQGREILLVRPFVDQRVIRHRCGMKKNGFNGDTANIFCAAPPNEWLAALLSQELSAAGFRVTSDPQQAGPDALRLDATLALFFIEAYVGAFSFSPEADLELHVIATNRAGLEARRTFYFKGHDVGTTGTEENYRLAAESAIRQMLRGVVGSVVQLTQQYPQLGLPSRVASSPTSSRSAESH